MKAGLLKERIIILGSENVTSEYGENKTTWSQKYSTRANVKFKSQDRANENNEIFYNSSVEFKVRYYVPVKERDRIKHKNKLYRILSIIPNSESQEITIITELINE